MLRVGQPCRRWEKARSCSLESRTPGKQARHGPWEQGRKPLSMGTAPGSPDSRMSSLMQARGGFRENGKGSGEGARGLSLQSQSVLEVSGGLLGCFPLFMLLLSWTMA